MGAPIVYRSDDVGAPVCDGQRGSVIALLKACLVDGYGTKAAAGWTMPFVNVDASQAAFRNDSVVGTGMFLQVDNTAAATNLVTIMAFETMTDSATGTSPFASTGIYYHRVSGTADAVARPWVVIADNRIVYIMSYGGAASPLVGDPVTYGTQFTVFGDIISNLSPDPYGCIFAASNSYYYSAYIAGMLRPTSTNGVTGCFFARNAAGDLADAKTNLVSGGGPGGDIIGQLGAPFGPTVPHMISRPYLSDQVAYSMRGYLPGLWGPCHAYPYAHLDTVVLDGKTMLALVVGKYNIKAMILIDVGATFRP